MYRPARITNLTVGWSAMDAWRDPAQFRKEYGTLQRFVRWPSATGRRQRTILTQSRVSIYCKYNSLALRSLYHLYCVLRAGFAWNGLKVNIACRIGSTELPATARKAAVKVDTTTNPRSGANQLGILARRASIAQCVEHVHVDGLISTLHMTSVK